MSRPLFIAGTASHVGKSWFTAAFCRWLANRGVHVAPFKGQNMSNNSYPAVDGGEIGRAQAVQAEAARTLPQVDMNPVLLKPNSMTGSQVVVQGKVWQTLDARDYYGHTDYLFDRVLESFHRLQERYERIVCEGAGSIAEVNLAGRDITNMRLAEAIDANVVLVADIERGGVFGSLVGTIELLPASQRRLIRAFAVNKFCGDVTLFDEGRRFLQERLQIPCLGVFPYARMIQIAEEDSLGLPVSSPESSIAVLRFPRLSNFTDFARMGSIAWIDGPSARSYATIFLPGSKNTIEDLRWLREQGLDRWLREQHERGAQIIGICGGYQMLGETIADPEQLESGGGLVEGLGLLPVRTVLRRPKTVRLVQAQAKGLAFSAYEIHLGVTDFLQPAEPFATLSDGAVDGCRSGRVLGTYLHGAFENADLVKQEMGFECPSIQGQNDYEALAEWLVAHSQPEVLGSLL